MIEEKLFLTIQMPSVSGRWLLKIVGVVMERGGQGGESERTARF